MIFYYVKANTKRYGRYTIFGEKGIGNGALHFQNMEAAIKAAASMQKHGKWNNVKVHIECIP